MKFKNKRVHDWKDLDKHAIAEAKRVGSMNYVFAMLSSFNRYQTTINFNEKISCVISNDPIGYFLLGFTCDIIYQYEGKYYAHEYSVEQNIDIFPNDKDILLDSRTGMIELSKQFKKNFVLREFGVTDYD